MDSGHDQPGSILWKVSEVNMPSPEEQAKQILNTADDFIDGRSTAAETQRKLSNEFETLIASGNAASVFEEMKKQGSNLTDTLPFVELGMKNKAGLPTSVHFREGSGRMLLNAAMDMSLPNVLHRRLRPRTEQRAIEVTLPEGSHTETTVRMQSKKKEGFKDPQAEQQGHKQR